MQLKTIIEVPFVYMQNLAIDYILGLRLYIVSDINTKMVYINFYHVVKDYSNCIHNSQQNVINRLYNTFK